MDKLCLVLLLLSQLTWADETNDIVEIPWLIWTHTVTAPGADGCPAAPYKAETRMLPCEPDPHDEMCRWISKDVKARSASYLAQMGPYLNELKTVREKSYRQAAKTLGPIPTAKDPAFFTYRKRFIEEVTKIFEAEKKGPQARIAASMEPSRKAVEANLNKTKNLLIKAITDSGRFKDYEHFFKKFLNCSIDMKLDPDELADNAHIGFQQSWGNSEAAMQNITRTGRDVRLVHKKPGSANKDSEADVALINPLQDEGAWGCSLTLTPTKWMECAAGTPACFQTLFHELGHLLASCEFQHLSLYARNHKTSVANDTEETRKSYAVVEFLEDQAKDFSKQLIEATSCLSAISAPKNPVLNSCPVDSSITTEYNQRCGATQLKGYESQWIEAEADLWGSSGIAKWLEETFKSREDRARALYEMWAEICSVAVDATNRQDDHAADVVALNKKILELPLSPPETKPKGCDEIAAVKNPGTPWNDVHQEWALRANRNYLRNSDLRRALGCPAKDSRIPVTCSPLEKHR